MGNVKSMKFLKYLVMAGCASIAMSSNAAFADGPSIDFDINSNDLSAALNEYGMQSDQEVFFKESEIQGMKVRALKGAYDSETALILLLESSGINYRINKMGTILVGSVAETMESGYQRISYNSNAEYEAGLGVYAEDATQDDSDQFFLEEVIVTASRREEALQDVAMSIATFNPDDFVAKGLTSIENIIDYTPGVNFVTDGGRAGAGSITMRGASQESLIPVVAVYIDDVPITTATPFANGSNTFFDGLLGDLERVEIVKGPQGTLYGASSMGGVVKYITKDPALEETRGSFGVDLSTIKRGGINQLYRGMISTPLVEDKVGITFSGFYNDQAGYIDRLAFDGQGTVLEEDHNTAEMYGFTATGLIQFSEDTRVKINGLYQTNTTHGGSDIDFIVANPGQPELEAEFGGFGQPRNVDTFVTTYRKADVTLNHDFGWAELTSVTGFSDFDQSSQFDNQDGLGWIADIVSGSEPGTTTSVPTVLAVESTKFIQEFRLASENNDTFEWQAGLFYVKENAKNDQVAISVPTDVNLFTVSFPSTYTEKAAFANATFYVTPNFDITVGARYSDNSTSADFDFTGILVPTQNLEEKVSDKVGTYLLNARWRLNDELSLYTRIANGYRPAYGNVPIVERDNEGNIIRQAQSLVNSDSLWSYEVGAKGTGFEGRFSYDVALWAIKWNDFQASLNINNLSTSGNSEAGMSSHGFEGTFNAFLTDNLRVVGTVAYTKSTLDADSRELTALKGERTRRLPDWTASFRANYDYQIGDIDSTFGLGLRYVGKYTTSYIGGYSEAFDDVLSDGSVSFPMDDYLLVDANASFTSGRFTLNIYATNLLDTYVIGNGIAAVFGNDFYALGSVGRPRTVGASVGVTF